MKARLTAAVIVTALGVLSCTKTAAPAEAVHETPSPEMAEVSFSFVTDGGTKAIDLTTDKGVINVAVWMYKGKTASNYASATADYFAYNGKGSDIHISCEAGTYYIKAVANLPYGFVDESDMGNADYRAPAFVNRYVALSEFNSTLVKGAYPMYSVNNDSQHRKAVSGSTSITMNMTRSVIKVTIDKVTNALPLKDGVAQVPTLKSVFLINGTSSFNLVTGQPRKASVADCYYTSARYNPGEALYPDFGQAVAPACALAEIAEATTVTSNVDLTGYPVFTAATSAESSLASVNTRLDALPVLGSWALRKTKVVLECEVGGKTCYYSQDLPAVANNVWVHWTNVRLTQIGTDSPDDTISFSDGSFTGDVTVTPWSNVDVTEVI